MRRVRFSSEARADLASIRAFTSRTWGSEQEARYMTALKLRISTLRRHPMTGHLRSEFGVGVRSAACGSHVIIYRDVGDAIQVLRVLHQRMDVGRHLGAIDDP